MQSCFSYSTSKEDKTNGLDILPRNLDFNHQTGQETRKMNVNGSRDNSGKSADSSKKEDNCASSEPLPSSNNKKVNGTLFYIKYRQPVSKIFYKLTCNTHRFSNSRNICIHNTANMIGKTLPKKIYIRFLGML